MSKYKKRLLILVSVALILLAFSFVLICWKNQVSDPRAAHRLFRFVVILHIAVVVSFLLSAILLYKQLNQELQKRDRICLMLFSCGLVLLLTFLLFGCDTLNQDPYDYTDYQVIQIPDSNVNLLVQEYSYFTVMGSHLYLEDDGKVGRYLGKIDYHSGNDDGIDHFRLENYRIVNHGDGSVTVQWIRQYTSSDQAIWDEKTFYTSDLS